jgi:hypothetical protein
MIGLNFTPTFELQNSPNDIKLVDTADYPGQGIANNQVSGIFELKSVVGIFHAGDPTFGTPDIIRGTTDTFTHAAPLDFNGVVLNGLYTFKYTVKVAAEQFALSLIGVDTTGKRFIVAGNMVYQVLNAIGGTVDITGYGLNVGTYTIDPLTVSYDAANDRTYIGVTSAIPDPAYAPYTAVWTTDMIYSLTKTVNYCFLETTVNLEVISDCFQNTLKTSDLTNYAANMCGVVIQPTVINGTMTIHYPENPTTGTPMASDVVVNINNANVSQTLNPICTGGFQVTLDVEVTYVLPDGTTFIVQLAGYKEHDVACEEGLCCASQCIENVKTNYDAAKGQNLAEATKLEKLLISIMSEWMLYSIFLECGNINKAQTHLANIIALVQASNCNCCPQTSSAPVWLTTPINSGAGITTVVTTCGNGITVTVSGTNPITYQVCLDTAVIGAMITMAMASQELFDHIDTDEQLPLRNNQVMMYNYSTSLWENILIGLEHLHNVDSSTIPGFNGYVLTWDSATGLAKFLPNIFHNILVNDFGSVGTIANNIETILKSYVLPANTLSAVGDFIKIEALIETNFGSSTTGIAKLKFGAVPSTLITLSPYNSTAYKIELQLAKLSPTVVGYEYKIFVSGLPAIVIGTFYGNINEVCANANTIEVTGQNVGTPIANSVICKLLCVTLNKI